MWSHPIITDNIGNIKQKDNKDSKNREPQPLIFIKPGLIIRRKADREYYEIINWYERLDKADHMFK